MKRIILTGIFLFTLVWSQAQWVVDNAYWFYFTDKDNNGYSANAPEDFLSTRSIQRRAWQGLAIDQRDLPVTGQYIDSLESLGVHILHVSRWLNGVLVQSMDTVLMDTLSRLSFLDTVRWQPDPAISYFPEITSGTRFPEPYATSPEYDYGSSEGQINQLHLDYLHREGYTGKGVRVTVLDGGFINLPYLPAFSSLISDGRLIATRNFVNSGESVYSILTHGSHVTSIIAANWPGMIIGAAPDAEIILALTENGLSESKIEEFAWIEAAEWADSLGTDILNTSLGYSEFDDSTTNYSYEDMDGNTAFISIANSLTASRGILSVTSAGNSGNDPWHYITAPADAFDILAAGAVDKDGVIASFSSRGPTYDHRIKPDICARGRGTVVQKTDSTVAAGSGTSYSSPMIAGASAVLWQAFPELSAKQMIRKILESGDRSFEPTVEYGYGIPNLAKAFDPDWVTVSPGLTAEFTVYPNPFYDVLSINTPGSESIYNITLVDLQGRLIMETESLLPGSIQLNPGLRSGLYILILRSDNMSFRSPVIKQ